MRSGGSCTAIPPALRSRACARSNTVQLGKTGTPPEIAPLPRCLQVGDWPEFRRLCEIRGLSPNCPVRLPSALRGSATIERAAVFAGACFSSSSVGDPAMPNSHPFPALRNWLSAPAFWSVTRLIHALIRHQTGETGLPHQTMCEFQRLIKFREHRLRSARR